MRISVHTNHAAMCIATLGPSHNREVTNGSATMRRVVTGTAAPSEDGGAIAYRRYVFSSDVHLLHAAAATVDYRLQRCLSVAASVG